MAPPSSRGCGVPPKVFREQAARQGYFRKGQKQLKEKEIMKSRKIIFTTALSALVCFGLCQQVQSQTNTAEGENALHSLTTGFYNSAFGFDAVLSITDQSFDTGVGAGALLVDTAGSNTAVGAGALLVNSTGSDNNAFGTFALFNHTTGFFNNAHGRNALFSNQDASENNAFGDLAMENNTTGSANTAIGDDALRNNVDGSDNVAVGDEAGTGITTGSNIIAIGAGVSGISTTNGELSDSCYIGNISGAGVNAGTAAAVFVDQDGKLGTTALPNTGTLPRAQALTGKVQELQAMVAQQQKQIEALTTGLQKVSAQLEVNKPAPQVVNNP